MSRPEKVGRRWEWLAKVAVWAVLVAFGFVAWNQFSPPESAQIPLSEFLKSVKSGQVRAVEIDGARVSGLLNDGQRVQTNGMVDTHFLTQLSDQGIQVIVKTPSRVSWWTDRLAPLLPVFVLIAAWVYFMRQMQGGGKDGAFSFGKSKARMLDETSNTVTFADVAGCDEAKEQVTELVEFLKDPQKFQKLGGRIPRGVLLVGPPGTGKTLLAKAIAGEAKVPFFSISGSDFVEMFVGVGAARVRDMFEQAKKSAPCIIFVDEIDAVGRHRGAGLGGGSDEREQTLNQMLVEMDGFETNLGVIVMAATNRPDILDPALLRPGRFDRRIRLTLPDLRGREQILNVHIKKVPVGRDVHTSQLSKKTVSFSGADLAHLVNEAALVAARRNARVVEDEDFEIASEKIRSSMNKRMLIESDSDLERVAVHEVGHVIASLVHGGLSTIHSVSIYAPYQPENFIVDSSESNVIISRTQARNTLVTLMGGRAAESVYFSDDPSNLGEQDLAFATTIAFDMVSRWGMHEGGLIANDDLIRARESKLGRSSMTIVEPNSTTNEAVVSLLQDAHASASATIRRNLPLLQEWADALMSSERLDEGWLEAARRKLQRVEGKVAPKSRIALSRVRADFAIITATEIERRAICDAFGFGPDMRMNVDSRVYWTGELADIRGGSRYCIVVAQLPGPGNVPAATLAHDMLNHWSPQAVLTVGIAGSANAAVKIGDIVVADAVWYYEPGKATDAGKVPAPLVYPADATLLNRAKGAPEWEGSLSKHPGLSEPPEVHFGVIASGERVVADRVVRDEVASAHRKILAIEMEGYGVSSSVWGSFSPVRHLVIRSISDASDASKDDQWQPYAAETAAKYTHHLLLDAPLEPLEKILS